MVQQLELFLIDDYLLVGVELIGLCKGLVEHIEEPFQRVLVHGIDLMELSDGEVEVSSPDGNRCIYLPRLVKELVCVANPLELLSHSLCAHLAFLQDLDQLLIGKDLVDVGTEVINDSRLSLFE